MARVITYQTVEQEDRLTATGAWPLRNARGHFTGAHHGLHQGSPTYDDADIAALIAGETVFGGVRRARD